MSEYNWEKHWELDEHPFHLPNYNSLLEQYWPKLQLSEKSNVLVPLCGKTLDLQWLSQQGHHAIGIEISNIASKEFFIENKIPYKIKHSNKFNCYVSDNITIFCGDFFDVTAEMLPKISAVYDRASLIALPEKLRQRYAQHLTELIDVNTQILLIVLDTLDSTHSHPHPVTQEEINRLYAKNFQIERVAKNKIEKISQFLYDRGYRNADEVVYHLKKQ